MNAPGRVGNIGLAPLIASLSPSTLSLLQSAPYGDELLKFVANLTWPQVVALVTFPVCAMKQAINCVQFWKASKVLVEADQVERWEKLHAKKE